MWNNGIVDSNIWQWLLQSCVICSPLLFFRFSSFPALFSSASSSSSSAASAFPLPLLSAGFWVLQSAGSLSWLALWHCPRALPLRCVLRPKAAQPSSPFSFFFLLSPFSFSFSFFLSPSFSSSFHMCLREFGFPARMFSLGGCLTMLLTHFFLRHVPPHGL